MSATFTLPSFRDAYTGVLKEKDTMYWSGVNPTYEGLLLGTFDGSTYEDWRVIELMLVGIDTLFRERDTDRERSFLVAGIKCACCRYTIA